MGPGCCGRCLPCRSRTRSTRAEASGGKACPGNSACLPASTLPAFHCLMFTAAEGREQAHSLATTMSHNAMRQECNAMFVGCVGSGEGREGVPGSNCSCRDGQSETKPPVLLCCNSGALGHSRHRQATRLAPSIYPSPPRGIPPRFPWRVLMYLSAASLPGPKTGVTSDPCTQRWS